MFMFNFALGSLLVSIFQYSAWLYRFSSLESEKKLFFTFFTSSKFPTSSESFLAVLHIYKIRKLFLTMSPRMFRTSSSVVSSLSSGISSRCFSQLVQRISLDSVCNDHYRCVLRNQNLWFFA